MLRWEAALLRRQERIACRTVRAVVAVSELEASYFRELGARQVVVAPNGVNVAGFSRLPIGRAMNPLRILFVGTLDWDRTFRPPRNSASRYFQRLEKRHPTSELWLVGKNPTREVELLDQKDGVTVAGSWQVSLLILNAPRSWLSRSKVAVEHA